ncbi:hypothetical protein ANCCAN_09369 [Ancylostoma caninum]|uniref:Secreted protein n=1 Tax=Ancylostoma caninum TaxID=29170 RepID=A0A368GMV5_ANCCA|nr:hypothetical protein ANCCAN_09369 [Ancylostoma caninum]
MTSRLGNILLLLPPLTMLSSVVGLNAQFARMFGGSLDPLHVELFAYSISEVIRSLSREGMQEIPACTEPTRPAPVCCLPVGGKFDALVEIETQNRQLWNIIK